MSTAHRLHPTRIALAAALAATLATGASADVITDWNIKSGELVVEAKLGTPPANRVLAIAHTAAYEAVNAITQRYPAGRLPVQAAPGASIEAAVAAAHHASLSKLMPAHQAAIGAAYAAALAQVADGPAKLAGIAVGERAAAAVLASRGEDASAAASPESYRPHTTAGAYVPTAMPAVPQWPQRKPWLMTSAAQFRPAPPASLGSAQWARDYNEIKLFGGKTSARRSAEQTEVARFWDYSLPPIYHGVVRSVANMPGREVTQNARLFAAATQAADDALIAVFEAKYHYNFWRPATAIRNGDADGNAATERDASWSPLIDNPMHPEYPSGHSILAGAIGAVLQAEIGTGRMPTLATTSPTATVKGAARQWVSVDAFMQEVSNARVHGGLHYRSTTDISTAMGQQIGTLAAAKILRGADSVAVPEPLKPGAHETLAMIVAAEGVQIYECRADQARAGAHAWTFVAPEAELFDVAGRRIGRHYAGPHWEATDGSRFAATVVARAEAPTEDDIPWLRLTTRDVAAQGSFGNVTSVQRVRTAGGVAPATGCSAATAGASARVPYTADYLFYVPQPTQHASQR